MIDLNLLLALSLGATDPAIHQGCFGPHSEAAWVAAKTTTTLQLKTQGQQPDGSDGPSINFGMSGAWYKPETSGQGMLIEVIPGRQLINVAWFTHAAVAASDDSSVQRWLFGTGSYSGDRVEMRLTLSRGGRFDAPPIPAPVDVGSLRLRFVDCSQAIADYDLFENAVRGAAVVNEGPRLTGSIELQRIGEPGVCEQLNLSSAEGLVAIRDVNLLPMDSDRVIPNQTVLVHGGQITALGPSAEVPLPFGTLIVEGAGKWLMPGLIEGHSHEIPLPFWPEDTAGNLLMYLANGITSIVNMGDFTGVLPTIAEQVRNNEIPGPTIYPGYFARGAADGGTPATFARNATEARQLVTRAAVEGYSFIKNYSRISRATFDVLVSEGARFGLPVLGHISVDFPYTQALQNGQRMTVHSSDVWAFAFAGGTSSAAIPGQAQLFRSNNVAVGTTLAVFELIRDFGLDALANRNLFDRVLLQEGVEFMDDRALLAWGTMFDDRPDIQVPRDISAGFAFMQALVKGFHDGGVRILPGSDTIGIPGVVPGFSMQRELELMKAAGMREFDILRAATRDHAEFIEENFAGPQEHFGVVEIGARADLLLLDADPRTDLRTLRSPAGVMARGHWYSGQWLRAQLEKLRVER